VHGPTQLGPVGRVTTNSQNSGLSLETGMVMCTSQPVRSVLSLIHPCIEMLRGRKDFVLQIFALSLEEKC